MSSCEPFFPEYAHTHEDILKLYHFEVSSDRFVGMKCAETTAQIRSFAMDYTHRGLYVNAIECYNKALCTAPPNTPMVGILCANRAEILFRMGLYAECLEGLKLALDNNYPGRLHCYLKSKVEFCIEKLTATLNDPREPQFIIRLSHPQNPHNPAVIKALQVKQNKQYGRHVVTDIDLKVGDVICIEEPFVQCIQAAQRYNRCTHCLKEAPYSLMPCAFCTSAMFCSKRCESTAWDEYHEHECPITDELLKIKHQSSLLSLRNFLTVMNLFNRDILKLKRFLEKNELRKINPFDLDHRRLNKRDQFLTFYKGHSDISHLSKELQTVNQMFAARLASLLGEYTCYSMQLTCDRTKVYLIELLTKFNAINSNNCYDIANGAKATERSSSGIGLYLCMSMATHACAGNVARMRVDDIKQMWVVTRGIAAGEQVLDNYGSFYSCQEKEERQERCSSHYGFECLCEACENDWPTTDKLPCPEEVPMPPKSCIRPGAPLSLERACAEMKTIREFMRDNEAFYPCYQLRAMEVRLMDLFHLLANEEPFENKYAEYFAPENSEGCNTRKAEEQN